MSLTVVLCPRGRTADLYEPDTILPQKFLGFQCRTHQRNSVVKVQSFVDISDDDREALLSRRAGGPYILKLGM